jgi:SET and MYND domain-containing protein
VFLKSLPIVDPRLELFHGQEEAREIAQAKCSEAAQVHEEAFVDEVDELLSRIQDESTTSTKRLSLLKEALALCSPLRERKLFAQPPYPVTLNELYLHYLTAPSTYTKALSVLLFIYLNCDLYNYPQPHHPIRVTRLFSIAKLLKTIEGLQNIDLVSANQTLLLCVRSLGSKSHGSESRFMKEVEEEIEDVETVQRTRGDVGVRLAEWSKEGTAEVGREYARKIFEGLRNIADDALSGVLNKS